MCRHVWTHVCRQCVDVWSGQTTQRMPPVSYVDMFTDMWSRPTATENVREQGTGHRAQGTGYRAQGTGYRAQGTDTESAVQGTRYWVQDTGLPIQSYLDYVHGEHYGLTLPRGHNLSIN